MLKRLFDLISSFFGLLIVSPFLLLIALLIKLDSKGPIIFKQKRVGKNGRIFVLYKFRTMVQNADKKGAKITINYDPRITKVGKFLRKYALDEFPQLINVLKGDMSIVGPRPEVPEYVKYYTMEQRKVLSIRPGLTGLAYILYKDADVNNTTKNDVHEIYIKKALPKKLALDLEYIRKQSFWLDLKIIFRTFFEIKH